MAKGLSKEQNFVLGCKRMTLLMDINKELDKLAELVRLCDENSALRHQYNRLWKVYDQTIAQEAKDLSSLQETLPQVL